MERKGGREEGNISQKVLRFLGQVYDCTQQYSNHAPCTIATAPQAESRTRARAKVRLYVSVTR